MANYSKIFGEGWYTKLKPYLEGSEFKKIGKELKRLSDGGQPVIPDFKSVFKAFEYCPWQKLSVVFLSSNSYQDERTGFAFNGRNEDVKLHERWFIESALLESGFSTEGPSFEKKWSEQGVLLLNTDLTSIKGKPGSHNKLWNPFISHTIKTISDYNSGLFFVLVGKEARKQVVNINPQSHEVLYIEHPMAAIKNNRKWDYKDCFNYINRVGNFLNNKKINW